MPPARRGECKTLSDLLADDVRDYFLREGVPDTPQPPQQRQKTTKSRRSHRHSNHAKAKSQRNPKRSATARSDASAGRDAAGTSSLSRSSRDDSMPVVRSERTGERWSGRVDSAKMGAASVKDAQRHQSLQRQTRPEEQFRGQSTAEHHGIATSTNGRYQQQHTNSAFQSHQRKNSNGNAHSRESPAASSLQHRRHGSGSGSFHSRGSSTVSSRGKQLSPADAVFLQRYAEEKERTNSRMLAARSPHLIGVDETRAHPSRAVPGLASSNPYHTLLTSPRPPTVTGSHRPGLPSIDNDDWEEDDRIEHLDRQKTERREARRLERHGRRTSSAGGGSIAGSSFAGDSVVMLHNHNRQPPQFREEGSIPREGNGAVFNATSTPGFATPGSNTITSAGVASNDTLCYSTGSSYVAGSWGAHPMGVQPPEVPPHHAREESAGMSMRRGSPGIATPMGRREAADGCGEQRFTQRQETKMTNDVPAAREGGKNNRHVRPLSYLSASSEGSEDVSASPRSQSRTPSSNYALSSYSCSSSSRTNQHPLHFTRQSSTDGSDLQSQSALLGAAFIDNVPAGHAALAGEYRRQRRLEDSSDGSYDSGESSESTSTSYDGDSSSGSCASWERRAPRYQNSSAGETWESVRFGSSEKAPLVYRDAKRERLRCEDDWFSGGVGPNYSSTENSASKGRPTNRQNRRSRKQHRFGGPGSVPLRLDDAIEVLLEKITAMSLVIELFISNMPSLVGSLALAWVSLGTDWFKWYEETFDSCHPVEYHSKRCVFPEFPGCFSCETESMGYQFTLNFHYFCSTIAFLLSALLVGKIIIAFPVVRDELANPTTAAPLGLLCMAFEKVFAGNFGYTGMGIAVLASALHTVVAGWFIFISVAYHNLPEPSWFSNTTGIGLAAAKIYLYSTPAGYFLCGLSLLAFLMFYLVALFRIHANDKISIPVCWVQLSGPAVVLYGFTIFSQPGSEQGVVALLIPENKEHFYEVHRRYYMPVMHILFAFCLLSMASSLYLLKTRWKSFREKEFSPAHVSFCAPLVSHTNAMQAYRSSLNKFSSTLPSTLFKTWLYRYWTLCLICGTVLAFVMTWNFFLFLPSWCQIDVENDELPPAPNDTIVTRLLQSGEARDEMKQNFVSAAVLQANESGALVRVLQDGRMKYVRSRRMPSMGFE